MCINCSDPLEALQRQRKADAQVLKGMAFLDGLAREGVISGDWDLLVDLERLDLNNSDLCVLGQIFHEAAQQAAAESWMWSGYYYGEALVNERDESVYGLGFNSVTCSWHELNAAWTIRIEQRQNGM